MSVISSAIDPTSPQTRTRGKSARAATRPKAEVVKAAEKRSWYVSPEATKRVAIHAAMEGRSQSDIVNELCEGLNRFTLPSVNSRAVKTAQPAADTGEDRQTETIA